MTHATTDNRWRQIIEERVEWGKMGICRPEIKTKKRKLFVTCNAS